MLWHMQDKVSHTHSHRLALQVCWSKPGTNNRENLSACHLPAAWEMSEATTALASVAQLALGEVGIGGGLWKRPSVSITHQEPGLKYHYSCTSQFASTDISETMSGSLSKSKNQKEKQTVTSVTAYNCKWGRTLQKCNWTHNQITHLKKTRRPLKD